MELSHEIAKALLEIKAVQIKTDNYFTWTSGIKSPIYCDNRLTMSYPKVRRKITKAFAQMIEQLEQKPDVIAGCATAGIPHAAWLAEEMNLPMVYVRSKPKGHGKGNQIEGAFAKNQNVIVIEDLISTGGSSIDSAKALLQEGVNVLGVMAIFTYGLEKSKQKFGESKLDFQTITTYDDMLVVLKENGEINEAETNELRAWRNSLS
ncbi:orotate phosphoribosyltransferase [Virgibacillus siamensis]|uniref:orotate phosphoribosyltransferase n=1 Tax=Virgibacillus siamensis TaxID=480071 RepID=UPI00098602AA|nr:orotate phosphoribosyltransferase [Virgibacillus siamensis]